MEDEARQARIDEAFSNHHSSAEELRSRAEHFSKKGKALIVFARLIEQGQVSEEEEDLLWSLVMDSVDF